MLNKYLSGAIAMGTVLTCVPALAEDAGQASIQNAPVFAFSGFGSVGAVQTNTDNGTFTTGFQLNGATKTIDMNPDTKFGAQMDVKFNDVLSATVQLLSKENSVGSYSPDVEWAFGKIKLGGGFDLRLGRIGAPFFMTSDFRNVGYTNVSVRTPTDVYQLVPIRSFDGGDILYETNVGDTTLHGQIWAGKSSVRVGQIPPDGDEDIVLHNISGINLSAENGPLTIRYGIMKARLGSEGTGLAGFNGLLAGLQTLSTKSPYLSSLGTIGSDLSVNAKLVTFQGVGVVFDSGNWVLNSEYVKRISSSDYTPTINAWYATLGYRVSTLTPYVSFSGRSNVNPVGYAMPAAGYPAALAPKVAALVAGANGAVNETTETTSALGVRWDAGKNYDIKAEFQKVKVPAGSAGIFKNIQGGSYAVDTDVNVISVVVDYVF